MKWIRQPALYAGQAAFLLKSDAPRAKVEEALRETFLFWAKFDNIDVPPLLRRSDLQVFEEAFRQQLIAAVGVQSGKAGINDAERFVNGQPYPRLLRRWYLRLLAVPTSAHPGKLAQLSPIGARRPAPHHLASIQLTLQHFADCGHRPAAWPSLLCAW
jgi:hypothetical protein